MGRLVVSSRVYFLENLRRSLVGWLSGVVGAYAGEFIDRAFLETVKLRTVTVGLSLVDVISSDPGELRRGVSEKISVVAELLGEAVTGVEEELRDILRRVFVDAGDLVDEITMYGGERGFIQTLRFTLTPVSIVAAAMVKRTRDRRSELLRLAAAISEAAQAGSLPVSFIGGWGVLASGGLTLAEKMFMDEMPVVLAPSPGEAGEAGYTIGELYPLLRRINMFVDLASTEKGINHEALARAAEIIVETGLRDHLYQDKYMDLDLEAVLRDIDMILRARGYGWREIKSMGAAEKLRGHIPYISNLARLAVFANSPEDNPFMAGGFHGLGMGEAVVSAGINGIGLWRLLYIGGPVRISGENIWFFVKTYSALAITLAEITVRLIQERMAWLAEKRGLDIRIEPGIIDLSLAPEPNRDPETGTPLNSVAKTVETLMGRGSSIGSPGSLTALGYLIDSVKAGGFFVATRVGGLSGTFIPVSEDAGMADALGRGTLDLGTYLAMTSVCSVGVDMLPITYPPEVERDEKARREYASKIAGIISDEATIGILHNKTTSTRILLVPEKIRNTPILKHIDAEEITLEYTEKGVTRQWIIFSPGKELLGAAPAITLRHYTPQEITTNNLPRSLKSLNN